MLPANYTYLGKEGIDCPRGNTPDNLVQEIVRVHGEGRVMSPCRNDGGKNEENHTSQPNVNKDRHRTRGGTGPVKLAYFGNHKLKVTRDVSSGCCLSASFTMHSIYARVNNVTATLSTTVMVLLASIALSSFIFTAQPTGALDASVKV